DRTALAGELRREDGADRPCVRRVVRMAAGLTVDGADVDAGRAPDAAKRRAPVGVGEDTRPPGVEQDEVEAPGPVSLAHTRPERRVRVHALARGRARQELQEDLEI